MGLAFSKKISSNKKYVGLFVIILLLVVAFVSISFVPFSYRPNNIGIIDIEGPITSYEKYRFISDMIDFSRDDESIKAIVLRLDCPGGYATTIQDIYMNLLELRQRKPIVASIVGLGASGGYYIALSANYIYAVPATRVGNIGVIATLPARPGILENILETGPYKQRGISESNFPFEIQLTLDEFLNVVELQRKDSLKLERTELSKGLMYPGRHAFEYGLIDELGSSQDAVKKAAELANLTRYSEVFVNEKIEDRIIVDSELTYDRSGLTLDALLKVRAPPAIFYIYANPELSFNERATSTSWPVKNSESKTNDGDFILVDISHNNSFAYWELNTLLYEVSSRSHSFRYVNSSEKLDLMLDDAKALIIINPKMHFSENEIISISKYVGSGGKLLLIADPTRDSSSYMNTLSAKFGMVYGAGYLYNMEENFGNYRNIIIDEFDENSVSKDLQKVVFYTATQILSENSKLDSGNSKNLLMYSSESEKPCEYLPYAFLSDKGILAIGDHTFLIEPYCYAADNYRLIQNIADFLCEPLTD
jgi:protease-4